MTLLSAEPSWEGLLILFAEALESREQGAAAEVMALFRLRNLADDLLEFTRETELRIPSRTEQLFKRALPDTGTPYPSSGGVPPPNLRPSTGDEQCGNCEFFDGSARCKLFAWDVSPTDLCDEWMSDADEDEPGAEPDYARDGSWGPAW